MALVRAARPAAKVPSAIPTRQPPPRSTGGTIPTVPRTPTHRGDHPDGPLDPPRPTRAACTAAVTATARAGSPPVAGGAPGRQGALARLE